MRFTLKDVHNKPVESAYLAQAPFAETLTLLTRIHHARALDWQSTKPPTIGITLVKQVGCMRVNIVY